MRGFYVVPSHETLRTIEPDLQQDYSTAAVLSNALFSSLHCTTDMDCSRDECFTPISAHESMYNSGEADPPATILIPLKSKPLRSLGDDSRKIGLVPRWPFDRCDVQNRARPAGENARARHRLRERKQAGDLEIHDLVPAVGGNPLILCGRSPASAGVVHKDIHVTQEFDRGIGERLRTIASAQIGGHGVVLIAGSLSWGTRSSLVDFREARNRLAPTRLKLRRSEVRARASLW